jgi:hypothetical protein
LIQFRDRRFNRGPAAREFFGADRAFVLYLFRELQLSLLLPAY